MADFNPNRHRHNMTPPGQYSSGHLVEVQQMAIPYPMNVPPQQQASLPETPLYLRPTIDFMGLPECSDSEDLRKVPSRHQSTWHTPQPLVGRARENQARRAIPPQTVRSSSGTSTERQQPSLSSQVHSPVQVYQPTQTSMFQRPNTQTFRNTVNERSFAHNLRQPHQSAFAMYQMQQMAGGVDQNASVQQTPSNPHQLEQRYSNSPMGAENLLYWQHDNQQYNERQPYQRGNIPLMYRPPLNIQCPEVNEFRMEPTFPYTSIPRQIDFIESSPEHCQPTNIQLGQSVQHPANPMFHNCGSIYEWNPYFPYCEEASENQLLYQQLNFNNHSQNIENESLSNITPKLSVENHQLFHQLESTWQSPEPYSNLGPESAESSNISDQGEHFDTDQQAGMLQLAQSMPCYPYQPRHPMYQEEESPMASEYHSQNSSPQSDTEHEIKNEDIKENPDDFHTEDIQNLPNASRNNLDCRYRYSPELASQSESTFNGASTCSIGYDKRQEIQVVSESENQRPETDPHEHQENENLNEDEYFRMRFGHFQFSFSERYKLKFGILTVATRMRQQTSPPPPNASENLGIQITEIDPEPVDCEFNSSDLHKKHENIRERKPVLSVISKTVSKPIATINPERYERAQLVQPQKNPHHTTEIYNRRCEPNVRENEIMRSSDHAGNIREREQVSPIKPQQTIDNNQIKTFDQAKEIASRVNHVEVQERERPPSVLPQTHSKQLTDKEIELFSSLIGNIGERRVASVMPLPKPSSSTDGCERQSLAREKEVQTSSVPASDIRERRRPPSVRPQTSQNQIVETDLEQHSGPGTSFQQNVIKSVSKPVHNAQDNKRPSLAIPQSPSNNRTRRPPGPKIWPRYERPELPSLETLQWLFRPPPPPSQPPPPPSAHKSGLVAHVMFSAPPPPEPIDLSPALDLSRSTTSIQQPATSSIPEEITLPPVSPASSMQLLITLEERPEPDSSTNHPDKRSAATRDDSEGSFNRKRHKE